MTGTAHARYEPAFASFEEKWLQANPEQRAVGVFLPPYARRLASAFGVLVHELTHAAFGVREAQVAAAKLSWWRDELAAMSAGSPRHPVTRELAAQIGVASFDQSRASQIIDGALSLLDGPAPSSLDAQFRELAAFYLPVSNLEAQLLRGDAAQLAANANLWTSAHLLRSVGAFAAEHSMTDRLPALPLDLLARHGLTHAQVGVPGGARAAFLRDYLAALTDRLDSALIAATHAQVGTRVRARLDLALAARAVRDADPLPRLAHGRTAGWRAVWLAWREARAAERARLVQRNLSPAP